MRVAAGDGVRIQLMQIRTKDRVSLEEEQAKILYINFVRVSWLIQILRTVDPA